MASLILGTLLTVSEPFEYVCGATLRIVGPNDDTQLAALRAGLLDHASQFTAVGTQRLELPIHWFIDAPTEGFLRLCLRTSDRQVGTQRLEAVARDYVAGIAARAGETRSTPTEAETVLGEFAAELNARVNAAQLQVERSLGSLPPSDPHEARAALLDRWRVLRAKLTQSREQLRKASAELTRLLDEPEPTHGIVSYEDRTEALAADDALQQDLRELEVNLTELKLHLLNVWQESAADLERLAIAADGLVATIGHLPDRVEGRSHTDTGKFHPSGRAAGFSLHEGSEPNQLVSESWTTPGKATGGTARRYRDLLEAFSNAWNKDFALLRRLAVDPLSGDIPAIHQRLRSARNDFLFTGSKHLAALRASVLTLGNGSEDRARLHVFESNVMRSFQAVQAAHRRFEFAAGSIETRDNFRLDTALKSARGLRRRSQQQIRLIDERLQEDAGKRARVLHAGALAAAQRSLERMRFEAVDLVEELVNLQEELNLSESLSEDFLRSTLQAEFAGRLTQAVRDDLTQTEDRLRDLKARRTSAPNDTTLELVECGVIAGPVNLPGRLRIGGLGALMTFLVVGLGQWWLNRPTP